jgi:putative (di)nucleoside polyphosphate hydrolase
MDINEYRHGVCIVLKKLRENLILVCHRIDSPDPDSGWQLPQGGIDEKKNLVDEAKRELREEIGTDSIAVLGTTERWYRYDYPEGPHAKHGKIYRGQCHRWVVAELLAPDSMIRFDSTVHAEFNAFKWEKPANVLKQIVDFKRQAYQSAFKDLELT